MARQAMVLLFVLMVRFGIRKEVILSNIKFAIKSGGGVYLSYMSPPCFYGHINEEGNYISDVIHFDTHDIAKKALSEIPSHYNAKIVKIISMIVYREDEEDCT